MTATTINPAVADARNEQSAGRRIAVWDVPTRVFHWLLAASFAGAFLSAESERWRDVHVMLGYTVLGLIGFRLIWGLVGSRYARFSSFAVGPSRLLAYVKSLFSGRPEHHVGHNPAGAVAIFLLLGLGVLVGVTGFATYNDIGGEWLEELHEGAANAMLGVVVIHVLGVIISSLLHRENLVGSMITGSKSGTPAEGITARHGLLGAALLVAVIGFWVAYLAPGAGSASGGGTAASAPWSKSPGEPRATKREHDDD